MEFYSGNDWRSYRLFHASQWVDENGNNTPAYNHKYWEENKDRIMARRRLLQAMEDGKYYDDDTDSYIEDITEDVEDYIEEKRKSGEMDDEDEKLLREELKREVDSVSSKKSGKKNPNNKKTETDESDADSETDEEKKKSGSGGSGSSKKSSSSSTKSASKGSGGSTGTRPKAYGKLGDPAKDRAKEEKAAKEAEKAAKGEKEGSGKSSGGSKSSEKSTKEKSTEKSTSKTTDEAAATTEKTTAQIAGERRANRLANFAKLDANGTSGTSPLDDYNEFISQIRSKTDEPVTTADEGIELWRAYRQSYGVKTGGEDSSREIAEAEVKKHKSTKKTDDEEDKKLQHGLDVFEDYLAHHGRLGQKWGVRNGPPYPLSGGQMTSAYKKNGGVSDSAQAVYGSRKVTKKKTSKGKKGSKIQYNSGATGYDESKYTKKKGPTDGELFIQDVKKVTAPAVESIKKAAKTFKENFNDASQQAAKREAERRQRKKEEIAKRKEQRIEEEKKPIDNKIAEKIEEEQKEELHSKVVTQNKEKTDAIISGDVNYAKDHFSEMTNRELEDLLGRAKLNENLDSYIAKQPKSDIMTKVDKVVNNVDKIRGWTDKGIKVWNTAASIYNAFNPDDPLKKINT